MYKAVITKIQTAKHPNADRLQIGYINGARVVVGLETKSGDLGIYFPSDGQLSKEFCDAHDLVARKDSETGVKIGGGYFAENRRVRNQAFRGVKSEGYWMPLSALAFTGYDLTKFREGDEFDELNGVKLCQKYYTPATLAAIQRNKSLLNDDSDKTKIYLPEHKDTTQFRFARLRKGDVVFVSEKIHGTSVRYGNVKVVRLKKDLKHTLKRALRYLGMNDLVKHKFFQNKEEYEYILGTRRAFLPKIDEYTYGSGYYGNGDPYTIAPKLLYGKLKEDEIVYGEVVGYLHTGAALFTQETKELKDVASQYGPKLDYSYGNPVGQHSFYAYRITQNGVELSNQQMLLRCKELGINAVPQTRKFIFDGNHPKLNSRLENMLEGPSVLDKRHIKEGICIRVESEVDGTRIYKFKSHTFGLLEGYLKDNESHVDLEEIA